MMLAHPLSHTPSEDAIVRLESRQNRLTRPENQKVGCKYRFERKVAEIVSLAVSRNQGG
jgi:hypothetical protein